MTIESHHNPKLKELRLLRTARGRAKSGPPPRFAAEGEDLLAAADAAGWEPVARYAAAGSGLPGTPVEPGALAKVSSLGSGTRTIAVFEQRWADPAGPLALALFGVADPGNVGTIVRSALAFGASSVVLGPGCADPYGPKAVRASMGAVFEVPLARTEGPEGLPGTTVALAARRGEPLHRRAGGAALTLLVGGERDGLPPAVAAAADEVRHIPIAAESLNAAMAATVALYETTRVPAQ